MEKQVPKELGQLIDAVKSAAREQGFSQKVLAERSGISESQVSRLFTGGSVSMEAVLRVAVELDGGLGGIIDRLRMPAGGQTDPKPKEARAADADLLSAVHEGGAMFHKVLNTGKLTTIAETARRVFQADACALFLLTNTSRSQLVLAASSSERCPADYNKDKILLVQSREGRGLTSHIVKAWIEGTEPLGVRNWSAQDLERDSHSSRDYQEFLSEGKAYSRLHIPLLQPDDRLLGVISVLNKTGPGGGVSSEYQFDENDRKIATALGACVSNIIHAHLRVNVYRDMVNEIQLDHDPNRYLEHFMEKVAGLVQADRGDIAIFGKDLTLRATVGEMTSNTIPTGQALPQKSFMRATWKSDKKFKMSADVSKEPDYHESDPRTKSALAIRLELNQRPIGVLNVESFRENAFSDADRELLIHFGEYCATAMQILGEEPALAEAVESVLENREFDETLREILRKLNEIYSIDGGIIYIADDDHQELVCKACVGYDDAQEKEALNFKFAYSEQSAATRVHESARPFFTPDVKMDNHVSKRGVEFFGIKGALIGVPLQVSGRVLGVLMAWRIHGTEPTKAHLYRLQVFAKLAAWTIELWRSKESKEKLQIEYKVADALPLQIFRKDVEGRFIFGNKAFCETLKRPWSEIQGKTDSAFYPDELAEKYRKDDLSVMSTKEVLDRRELNRPLAEEQPVEVRVLKVPIFDGNRVSGVQVIFWNLDQRG